MRPRGNRHRRQLEHERQVVAGGFADSRRIEHRRDQSETVQLQVNEIGRERGQPVPAEALADQMDRGVYPIVQFQPAPHENADCGCVILHSQQPMSRLVAQDPAEAGADRVNEHEIGDVDEGSGVRHRRPLLQYSRAERVHVKG